MLRAVNISCNVCGSRSAIMTATSPGSIPLIGSIIAVTGSPGARFANVNVTIVMPNNTGNEIKIRRRI